MVITNNLTATTFLKIVSTIKQDTDQIKLNYILSNLKILKSHPSFPNIVYSEYNCIYRSQSNSNVIELACIYDGKDSTRFIFAYNSKQIKKEEINKFYTASYEIITSISRALVEYLILKTKGEIRAKLLTI